MFFTLVPERNNVINNDSDSDFFFARMREFWCVK